MSDGVHLLIPFAMCSAPGCGEALRGLALPHLQKLLGRLKPVADDTGDAHSLSMPHERVLARAYGMEAPDGLIAWAAWQARQAGHPASNEAWAWITPCHWRVGTDHVAMSHPQELQLDAEDSRALLEAMRPYFEQDGIALEYDAPTLWLARGELFRHLPTASLDRVVGRVLDPWMPHGDAARPLRRLQQEMQMLLYTHRVNDERQRGGLLPVNSFWASGTGALPTGREPVAPPGLQITHYLRDAALRDDGHAWAAAWQQLDARDGARLLAELERGRTVTLTLCGERNARTWSGAGRAGLWQRATGWLNPQTPAMVLEPL
jgi:hypothetical protein